MCHAQSMNNVECAEKMKDLNNAYFHNEENLEKIVEVRSTQELSHSRKLGQKLVRTSFFSCPWVVKGRVVKTMLERADKKAADVIRTPDKHLRAKMYAGDIIPISFSAN